MMGRKGVSPIIATVMLIALAFALAVIIFLWAKGFLAEKTQKLGEPAEYSCERISFEAEAITGENGGISMVNRGNVPLYGAEIRKKGLGAIKNVGVFDRTINIGEDAKIEMPSGINKEDVIILVPIVLGEVKGAKRSFTCDVSAGQEITVK